MANSTVSSPNGPDCTRRAIGSILCAPVSIRRRSFPTPRTSHRFLVVPTMATETQRQNDALSSLNIDIGALDRAKEAASVTPAKAAFTSAGVLLTVIRVGFLPVHVGRSLANVCRTRWLKKRTMSNYTANRIRRRGDVKEGHHPISRLPRDGYLWMHNLPLFDITRHRGCL